MALPPPVGPRLPRAKRAPPPSASSSLTTLLYAVASGPLYGLAYKFALTVFMENIRIHGSVIASDEFRQGPVEALDRQGWTLSS